MADGTVIYAENADGIGTSIARNGSDGVHVSSCGVYNCGDDQIDMSHSRNSSVSWSVAIGGNKDRLPNGDGNGFKVGNNTEDIGVIGQCRNLTIRHVYAIGNRANGIDGRNCIGHAYSDCVAYGNKGRFAFSGGNDTSAPKTFSNVIAIGPVPSRDRNHVIRSDPGWADPTKPIDTTWQGDARSTFDHVWRQVQHNFATN